MTIYIVFTKENNEIEEWPDAYINESWAEARKEELIEKYKYKPENVLLIKTEVMIQEQGRLF